MDFQHVDVFADEAFTGNSLAVFIGDGSLTTGQLLAITQEFRHFESVFLTATQAPDRWRARVFDLLGELDFAGHPVLGAAAALHERLGGGAVRNWLMDLPVGTVVVEAIASGAGYRATMDQGRPEYGPVLTGITVSDFGDRLAGVGAQFAYLLDPDQLEGRHWSNDGRAEDVATGSAAGIVGAYLARSESVPMNEAFVLHQGRFAGRPSRLRVTPQGRPEDVVRVLVSGDVVLVARGTLAATPGAGR
jgi:trans-2,3-dihydro-3-hydroxyanthranilate isomerase